MEGAAQDIFNNKNKQAVRTELWLPCFIKIRPSLDKNSLRFLCFPARNCLFVDHLLKSNLITKNDFIIGIERDSIDYPPIKTFISMHFDIHNWKVYQSQFQDLLYNEDFKKKFPFDIAEIDINESFHEIDDEKHLIYLNTMRLFFQIQNFSFNDERRAHRKKFRKCFYLFLTSKLTRGHKARDFSKELMEDLREELESYLKKVNSNEFCTNLAKKENLDETEMKFLSLLVIALRIIDSTTSPFEIRLITPPYCYSGRKGKAIMGAFVFQCIELKRKKGNGIVFGENEKSNMQVAVELVSRTNFLPEPEI